MMSTQVPEQGEEEQMSTEEIMVILRRIKENNAEVFRRLADK